MRPQLVVSHSRTDRRKNHTNRILWFQLGPLRQRYEIRKRRRWGELSNYRANDRVKPKRNAFLKGVDERVLTTAIFQICAFAELGVAVWSGRIATEKGLANVCKWRSSENLRRN
jgi:hypothetical protein